MKTTMDAAGRIVIPKEIRRAAGLQPGMALDVTWEDGRVQIEPATLPVRLVREGRLLIAIPLVEVPPLTTETIEATRAQIFQQRAAEIE
jgi:AbrB family looped-hinge helix DNA binding protein